MFPVKSLSLSLFLKHILDLPVFVLFQLCSQGVWNERVEKSFILKSQMKKWLVKNFDKYVFIIFHKLEFMWIKDKDGKRNGK